MTGASIVAAAEGAGYATFAAALQASPYVEVLDSGGPFTVFAPTDAAFAKFAHEALDRLLHGDADRLRSVLGYHFVAGKVMAKRFQGRRLRAVMYAGGDVIINGRSGLRVNSANLTEPDILSGACVMHGIDGVLWPHAASAVSL